MGAVSPVHLIVVLVVAMLVLGPGKLPETGEALGRAVRDFRRALAGDDDVPSVRRSADEATGTDAGPAAATPPPATMGGASEPEA